MKQDRFLTGILVAIGVLVVVALALFFLRQDKQDYVADDKPEGVVHNYVLAVQRKDYEKGYDYLAEGENKPTITQFRQSFVNNMVNPNNTGVEIGSAEISGNDAYVGLSLIYTPSDPFSSAYRNNDQAVLTRQNGAWKISRMPYNFWDYNWYQPVPVKP
jgi:hypothetical protein